MAATMVPAPSSRSGPITTRCRQGAVSARAELSSVATALEELALRVAAIGDALSGEERDALRSDLFEVERALGTAARRLSRALDNR